MIRITGGKQLTTPPQAGHKASMAAILLIGLLLLPFVLPGCKTLQKTGRSHPPVVLYNPGKTVLHPEFVVYHHTDDESTLYFRVLISEILMSQANPELKERGQLRLAWTLYSSFQNLEITARDTADFIVYKERAGEAFVGSVKLPARNGQTYMLELMLEDAVRKSRIQHFVLVDRFSQHPQQDFLVLQHPGNVPGFQTFFYSDEQFRIIQRASREGNIYVSRFQLNRTLPRPPYDVTEYQDPIPVPDSTWIETWSHQKLFELRKEGVYLFHLKAAPVEGLCLLHISDHFPQIQHSDDLLPPLQYLTTEDEFRIMMAQDNPKKAADDFWLEKGKSFANARDLIRVYYNRVLFANHYFTTSKEGWLSDRGMIYVLMGPPAEVIRAESEEIWVYNRTDTNQKYAFRFVLRNDPFTGFDFRLNRTEDHRSLWNLAIATWRQGKIFSL